MNVNNRLVKPIREELANCVINAAMKDGSSSLFQTEANVICIIKENGTTEINLQVKG